VQPPRPHYQGVLRSLAVLVLGVAMLLSFPTGPALAARSPTYLERVTIMDVYNVPGRSFASKCVRILVSTADPRYAKLTGPSKPIPACVQAGEVGDGYVVFRRPSRRSLHWRDLVEASDPPCHFRIPAAVLRDLFPTFTC
jgi:hypothetical protein